MESAPLAPIIAFSSLRWEALPAGSQRILARFARTRSVFVLEEPETIEAGDREFWELKCGAPDLLVCRPRVAASADVSQLSTLTRMARALLRWLDIGEFVAWVYSTDAHTWAKALAPSLMIHDEDVDSDAFQRALLPLLDEVGDARRPGQTPFEVGAAPFPRRALEEPAPAD